MYNKDMPERSTQNQVPGGGEESDAGEAKPADGLAQPACATRKDLLDGPPPGWRAGIVALDSAGAKAEKLGIETHYEHVVPETDPESHIVRGQE